jgi:hypothetical protein
MDSHHGMKLKKKRKRIAVCLLAGNYSVAAVELCLLQLTLWSIFLLKAPTTIDTASFQILAKTHTGKLRTLDNIASSSVLDVKQGIQEKVDVPVCQQQLIFTDKQLEDGQTLADHNTKKNKHHLILRSTGC